MKHKKPKHPGQMISKINASKKRHHKDLTFEVQTPKANPKAPTIANLFRGTYKPKTATATPMSLQGSSPKLQGSKIMKKKKPHKKASKRNWIAKVPKMSKKSKHSVHHKKGTMCKGC